MNIIQPIDLPKNKDKDWLKRTTKAISEKKFHLLGTLAKELESLTTKEKEQFVDDKLWKKTLDEVTKQTIEKEKIDSYKQYLKSTTIAYYGAKAQSEIDTLQYIVDEREAWEKVNNENTRFIYEEYIKYFSKSDNIKEVKSRLKQLLETENKVYQTQLIVDEKEAWEKALRLNSKNSYKVYLSNYPNHLHTDEAKEKKKLIVQKEERLLAKEQLIWEEKNAWDRAVRLDSQNSYTEYLNSYSQHENSQSAKIRLDEIIATKKEKVFWKETKELHTIKSYQKYVEMYPDGLHIDKAQSLLNDFLIIAKKQQQDKEAWNNAQLENTVEGYEYYLFKYQNGLYSSSASDSITLLIQGDMEELMRWANQNNIHSDKLPRNIDELIKISKLDISNKDLTSLPKVILSLKNLDSLDISNNKFKTCPKWFSKLSTLENLNMSNNVLITIFDKIDELDNLINLNISNNQLKNLPESICFLRKLQYLNISGNKIELLPINIGNLKNLVFLEISPRYGNSIYLREFPKSIWELNNLDSNSLNHLHDISKKITQYENSIWNNANSLKTSDGYEKYLKYFKNGQYVESAKERLNEIIEEKYIWDNAVKGQEYSSYIKKYPEGKYITEAHSKREQQFWDTALVRNSEYKYKDYLRWYPSGRYANEAKKKLEKLENKKLIIIGIIVALIILTILISTGWWQPVLSFIVGIFTLAIAGAIIGVIFG